MISIALEDEIESAKSKDKVALAAPSVAESPPETEADTVGGGGVVLSDVSAPPEQAARLAKQRRNAIDLVSSDIGIH